jgi:hypothetical protein
MPFLSSAKIEEYHHLSWEIVRWLRGIVDSSVYHLISLACISRKHYPFTFFRSHYLDGAKMVARKKGR